MVAATMTEAVGGGSFGPRDVLDTLKTRPEQRYPFIVRFDDDLVESARKAGLDPAAPEVDALQLINGVSATIPVARALELSESAGVAQVWYLHPELAPLYVRTIKALQYNVETLPLPSLVNLSIGPEPRFWTETPYPEEPFHAATKAAAEAGLIPVIAIGNLDRAERRAGWINPWCWPEWVICVGAYDPAAGAVAAFSARGAPDRPESWPDVVADGVDVIGPYPTHLTKSAERKRRDEANPRFRELIAPDKWDIYTLESGTSQATALVSGAAAQVLHFLKGMLAERAELATGAPLFSLTAPPDRITTYDERKPRLTGRATPQEDGSVVYEYAIDLPWKMVKQLLIDTALPVAGAPHEIGAGLVERDYIQQQFGQYGLVEVQIFSSKVLDR